MPDFEFTSPEGKKYTITGPAGATKEQAFQMLQTQLSGSQAGAQAPAKKQIAIKQYEPSFMESMGDHLGNAAAGTVRGAGSIGATLAYPWDKAQDLYHGDRKANLESVITGNAPMSRNEQRRHQMTVGLGEMGADTDSLMFKTGKIGGEIAGTLGAGGALANVAVRAAPSLATVAPTLVQAIRTGGMSTGAPAALTMGAKAANMGTRIAGGAITGGASAALIDPKHGGAGAVVGGALPPALAGVGKVGRAIGSSLAGKAATPEMRAAAQAARDVGYVMPPTMVRPTMGNRLLEGYAGKLTTAQNASAKNAPITDELARKAIGATNLTEAGIYQVRAGANKAYEELGKFGTFRADAGFQRALDAAGASTKEMRQNFPGLVDSKIDDLVSGLRSRTEFSAQSTIEAMKQFRANAAANKASLDPAAKAMGRAQAKIAAALEDMVERNLQGSGQAALLDSFRAARQTLAKTHEVEKALNKVTGSVDANKLAQALQKGRPLSGDLKTIAEFAARFPTANKTVEKMGSLPGISPLDFVGMRLGSIAGAVVGRPAARALVLSGPVQNRLAAAAGSGGPMIGPGTNQLLHRLGGPVSAR